MSNNKYKELFDKAILDSSVKDKIEEKIFTMNFKIEIGETEKHTIEFVFDRFWGYVLIKVDGQPYKRKVMLWIKQTQSYEIKIGSIEKHIVRIALIRSGFPIGARECTAWVYVDNKLKGQFDRSLRFKRKRYRDMNLCGKTAVILSSILIIAIVVFSIIYHLPVNIEVDIDGALIRAGASEPEYYQPINIKIEGKYYRLLNLVTPYRFRGSSHVYEIQRDVEIEVQSNEAPFTINLGKPVIEGYVETIRSFGHFFNGGFFYMKPDKSAIMIVVFERDEDGEEGPAGGLDGLYYVAPCSTREEALEIINEMRPIVWGRDVTPIE